MYLYRADDSVGDTVEFFFSENHDLPTAKRFFIDGSQTNHEGSVAGSMCKTILATSRQSASSAAASKRSRMHVIFSSQKQKA